MSTSGPIKEGVQLSLFPEAHEHAVEVYERICEHVREQIIGCEVKIERIGIIGTRHVIRDTRVDSAPLRVLITRPARSGKTSFATAFAGALGLPAVTIPAQAMAEMNWSGADIGDYLGQLYGHPSVLRFDGLTPDPLGRAVVVIDDIDALRLPGRYGSATTREYQEGRQHSLVPLFAGEKIPIERSGSTNYWPARYALVIAVGSFEELKGTTPTARALHDWGLIRPVAEWLCSGAVVCLPDLSPSLLARVVERSTHGSIAAFATFGYRLSVSPEAIAFVLDYAQDDSGTSTSDAAACVMEAADRVLIGMVRDRVPAGAHRVLAPDDIRLRPASRGLWRE